MPLLAGAPAGSGSITPTKTGWHLVQFADGYAAIVRWAQGHWWWGSITPPASEISSISYIAPTVQDIAGAGGQRLWGDAMRLLTAKQSQVLTGSLDYGTLQQGQPTMVDAAGTFVTGPATAQAPGSQFGSSAVGTGPNVNIPNPLSGIDAVGQVFTDIWNWVSNGKNWLRVLEVIAGALAVWFAIKSLTGIETPKISIAKAAAAVA